jgi:phosphoribosylaminoimidazole-succinocarboxamide synthase
MLSDDRILSAIPHALRQVELPGGLPQGKVCDFYVTLDGKTRVLIFTDRLNVFDYEIGLVPYKGQAICGLAAWWLQNTADVFPNHFVQQIDPNIMIVREARPISVSVVAHGYLTGVSSTSLWPRYQAGERRIGAVDLPNGLRKNDPLPQPVVTTTTKATVGRGDRSTLDDVVKHGYVSVAVWDQMQAAALALYMRGTEIASERGLILADAKYEFGYDLETNALTLIDELHTPESSRFWKAQTYQDARAIGQQPHHLDKELARLWIQANHPDGKTLPDQMPDILALELSRAFQEVYESITGQPLTATAYPIDERVVDAIAEYA